MANPIAIAGSNVGSGSLITPGGAQGVQGIQGPTSVSADSGNIAQLGSDNLILVPQTTLWSQRLRSFNAVGNPNFEVDARMCGTSTNNTANGAWIQDRWQNIKGGMSTMQWGTGQSTKQMACYPPGTTYRITNNGLFVALQAQQASLAAGDVGMINHYVEGPQLRELIDDVHSISILCYTNVAGGLKIALSLRDPAQAHSLCKLCTIPSANTPTLITLPNIPIWSASGNFTVAPGANGYIIGICFAAGSTYMPAANDTWQNANVVGAIGMDNLGSKPVGSNLVIGVIQHEPGPNCTTLIDKPFSQNLDECLRYYQKSYDYATKPGTGTTPPGFVSGTISNVTQWAVGFPSYPKPLAKAVNPQIYSPSNGASNSVYNVSTGLVVTLTGGTGASEKRFGDLSMAAQAIGQWIYCHYVSDTGM